MKKQEEKFQRTRSSTCLKAGGFWDSLLNSAIQGYSKAVKSLAVYAADHAGLEAKFIGTSHSGGKITAVKRLDSGRVLLTVNREDGSREQFVVTIPTPKGRASVG